MPKVYLAGPIDGRTVEQCVGWRNEAARLLRYHGVGVLDPLRDKVLEAHRGLTLGNKEKALAGWMVRFHTIVRRDRNDIYTCDGMIVMIDDGPPSRGTDIEIGWADAWCKPMVFVMSEQHRFRDHPFAELGMAIVPSVSIAVAVMVSVFGLTTAEPDDAIRLA